MHTKKSVVFRIISKLFVGKDQPGNRVIEPSLYAQGITISLHLALGGLQRVLLQGIYHNSLANLHSGVRTNGKAGIVSQAPACQRITAKKFWGVLPYPQSTQNHFSSLCYLTTALFYEAAGWNRSISKDFHCSSLNSLKFWVASSLANSRYTGRRKWTQAESIAATYAKHVFVNFSLLRPRKST